jgi:hypothetical protein
MSKLLSYYGIDAGAQLHDNRAVQCVICREHIYFLTVDEISSLKPFHNQVFSLHRIKEKGGSYIQRFCKFSL